MIAWIPYSTICVIQIYHYSEQVEYILTTFFVYLPYIQALFLPYICISFVPDMKHKFCVLFTLLYYQKIIHRNNQIYPNHHYR